MSVCNKIYAQATMLFVLAGISAWAQQSSVSPTDETSASGGRQRVSAQPAVESQASDNTGDDRTQSGNADSRMHSMPGMDMGSMTANTLVGEIENHATSGTSAEPC